MWNNCPGQISSLEGSHGPVPGDMILKGHIEMHDSCNQCWEGGGEDRRATGVDMINIAWGYIKRSPNALFRFEIAERIRMR